jgi:hypothetical protein
MFMRSLRTCLVFAAVLTLWGCHSGTDPIVAQHADLDRAEAQWLASGIHDYWYDVGTYSAWFVDSLRVEVRNDTVRSATLLRGNTQVHGFGRTVPELFAAIRQGMASGSDVRVSYDGVLGYPVHIDIPDPPGVADAEWGANIGNFLPLAPTR